MRASLLLLLTPFAVGCAVDTTGPRPIPFQSRLSVAAASEESPKIMRFRDQFVFGILDTKTDLIAFAGLPDDISRSLDCGGTDPFAVVDFKSVEVREGIIHLLVRGEDVNLDVYQLSTFEDVCTSTPIAHGKGTIKYHDNDVFETGTENTFGWWAGGPVSLASGGSANLLMHNQWQLLPDGTFRRIFRQVKLSGQ
jgi:hypothetical protein